MSEPKAIRIEVEFENGQLKRATGEDASVIWRAIQSGFVMEHVHGRPYQGPQMKIVREGKND